MKKLFLSCSLFLTLFLTIIPLRAQTSTPEAGLLQTAYTNLAEAKHDYKGHRVKAMWHLQAAAKQLGIKLQGKGKIHERQAASDAQLRAARSQLEQTDSALTESNPQAAEQVENAIAEISAALRIR